MKNILSYFIGALLIAGCQEKSTGEDPIPEVRQLNVAYGNDPHQKMDIYLPKDRNSNSTKVIVLIHGGGWNQGDKNDFTPYVDSIKKYLPEYAIFNINYRLANGSANLFPAQENDVKAAIDFIYSKRSSYGVSDKYVLLGASAGGHLAALHAYKYSTPVSVKAVVDFFGPTELVEMYNNPVNPLVPLLLESVTGGTPVTQPSIYQQSSPTHFVDNQSPPSIILHGGVDGLVPASQSVLLRDKLLAAGVITQYVFYPNENHGWGGANLTDSFEKIAGFLEENVE